VAENLLADPEAITLRFVQKTFVENYDPTIEDAYRQSIRVDTYSFMMQILDTAGQEDYVSLRSSWIRDKDGLIMVFDLSSRKSFEEVQSYLDQVLELYEDQVPPILLVGNKCDLENREIKESEAKEVAKDYLCVEYLDSSAKSGVNIDAIFHRLGRHIRERDLVPREIEPVEPEPWWSSLLSWCGLL
jgi:small GTP-binding protein